MTDNELKKLVASISTGIKELTESQKKTDQQLQETDRQFQETDRKLKSIAEVISGGSQETDRQFQETDRKLKSIAEMVGGIGNNQGDVTEEFFVRGFNESMTLGGMTFDALLKNYSVCRGKLKDEFDIVLVNGDSVVLIEVKYKVHPKDIRKILEKKLPNFRRLAPDYNNHKLYGAIAGFSIPDQLISEAEESGLFVLGRAGTNMAVLADKPIAF